MRRIAGILFGAMAHVLFFLTVWQLFWFLKGDARAVESGSLELDFALTLQFAVPHSMLLLPAVRNRLERLIPSAFYGCFYCLVTCLSLLATFRYWHTSETVLWQFSGAGKLGIQAAFIGSWIALFYSLHLTGLGYQTGWTPWWHWFRRRSLPRREFNPRGAYRLLRHPVYLSFLGLLWFTPTMSLDRTVLTGTWTVYIFVGSYLKDRRLVYYVGQAYRRYAAKVPGYPGMFFGPLARFTDEPAEPPHASGAPAPRRTRIAA